MPNKIIRIDLVGRIGTATAEALGGALIPAEGGDEFVTAYVDQAQLTGLLIQLADLHIPFNRVAITNEPTNQGSDR